MRLPFTARISLADKCLLLFGGAVVLIVAVALLVPGMRMNALVDEGQLDLSRRLVEAWVAAGDPVTTPEGSSLVERAGVPVRVLDTAGARELAQDDHFIARSLSRFDASADVDEMAAATWDGLTRVYHFARPIRDADGAVVGMLSLDRASERAASLLAVNTAFLFGAGAMVLALAVLVFYLITHRLILSPVRELRETADRVRVGDLTTRSAIATGDEFEELSDTFNEMLETLQRNADQLRAINKALDVKLNELAEANVALFESARLKGDFLASISHELRTPMNSIIGFGELLLEIARAEQVAGDDSTRLNKRIRYLDNIVSSARRLLEMINSLLEMARIEAGRVEINVEPVSLHEACEGLAGLVHPQAEREGVEVRLEVEPDVPVIETDLQKLQQIVSNFLANAVKFIRAGGEGAEHPLIILRAERLGPSDEDDEPHDRVRISVIDNGPGIAPEDQQRVFEKFEQLDAGHTRAHTGTGLGLAISRELAGVLQGEIQLVSELGRGSMFSLILPVKLDESRSAELRLEAAFRGTLAGRRSME